MSPGPCSDRSSFSPLASSAWAQRASPTPATLLRALSHGKEEEMEWEVGVVASDDRNGLNSIFCSNSLRNLNHTPKRPNS